MSKWREVINSGSRHGNARWLAGPRKAELWIDLEWPQFGLFTLNVYLFVTGSLLQMPCIRRRFTLTLADRLLLRSSIRVLT